MTFIVGSLVVKLPIFATILQGILQHVASGIMPLGKLTYKLQVFLLLLLRNLFNLLPKLNFSSVEQRRVAIEPCCRHDGASN